jgi:hypothetical protein
LVANVEENDMGIHSVEKKQLSAKGMLQKIHAIFQKIPEPAKDSRGLKTKIPLADCLMSGLAVFGLKIPSLLQFDEYSNDVVVTHNLRTLYQVKQPPSDTYMRERLDKIDPQLLRSAFTGLFSLLQRGKVIEDYKFLGEYVLYQSQQISSYLSASKRRKSTIVNGIVLTQYNAVCDRRFVGSFHAAQM